MKLLLTFRLILQVLWLSFEEHVILRNAFVQEVSTTILMMWARMCIITLSLRCLATGHSEITSRKEQLTSLGNSLRRFMVWILPDCRILLETLTISYVTYFEGSETDGVECDTEAYEIWKTHLPEDHILKGNKKVR